MMSYKDLEKVRTERATREKAVAEKGRGKRGRKRIHTGHLEEEGVASP